MSLGGGHDASLEIGIVVRDLEATSLFYREGLGLSHVADVLAPMGLMRRFACGGGILKLMQLTDTPTAANPPGGITGGCTGLRWLSFRVSDIEGVSRRCVTAGGRVAWPIEEWRPGLKVVVLEDPEASCWIELAEQGDP